MKQSLCKGMMMVLAIGLLAGCQKTLESPIVHSKDLERMLESAVQTPESLIGEVLPEGAEAIAGASPLYRQLGAPQAYRVELAPRTEKLSVVVDAVVKLPMAEGMPIARVRPTQFTQEMVTTFFNLLCGDTAMYDTGSSNMTRVQLDANILMYQKRVQEDSGNTKARAMLDYFLGLRAQAPEDIEETRSSGQLREMTFSSGKPEVGRYMGIRAVENPLDLMPAGKQLWVRNDMDVMDWSDESIDWGEEIGAHMAYYNSRNAQGIEGSPSYAAILDESTVPERARGRLSITPAQARAQVDALLRQCGSGYLTENVYLYELLVDQEEGQPVRPNSFAYTVTCGYGIGGIPCRTVTEADGNNFKTLTSMAPSWLYERMEWEVTDKGISRFSWQAPMEVTELVMQSAALLPFAEISEIFQRMLLVAHESNAMGDSSLITKEIVINRVALELQRATEPGAIDGGIVIPVWNFYGSVNYIYSPGEDNYSDNTMTPSLLTINAIDGSIIDAWKGY